MSTAADNITETTVRVCEYCGRPLPTRNKRWCCKEHQEAARLAWLESRPPPPSDAEMAVEANAALTAMREYVEGGEQR